MVVFLFCYHPLLLHGSHSRSRCRWCYCCFCCYSFWIYKWAIYIMFVTRKKETECREFSHRIPNCKCVILRISVCCCFSLSFSHFLFRRKGKYRATADFHYNRSRPRYKRNCRKVCERIFRQNYRFNGDDGRCEKSLSRVSCLF